MEQTDTWAAFGNEWLKAIEVKNDTDEYAIVGVDSQKEDSKTTLVLLLQRGELEKKFGCNQTNKQAVQLECEKSPKDAIGRKITFFKVKTNKPGTTEIVDGLRLCFVKDSKSIPEVEVGIEENGTM